MMRRFAHGSMLSAALLLAAVAPTCADELRIAFISDSFGGERAPALASLRAMNPAGVFIIGDFPHDNPAANCNTSAGCLAKMRAMYANVYQGQTPLGRDYKREIIDAGIPLLGRINDDHEQRDNVSNKFKWWPEALTAFREYHTLPADNGLELGYLYHRVAMPPTILNVLPDAIFLLLDVRTHREAGKTILGAEQKVWLTAKLAECALVPWCVLVSPVPFNPNQHKLDSWFGFPADRAWLLEQIQAAGVRPLIVSGDLHWGSIGLPPKETLPELNIPQLNPGFSNTGNNSPDQWTLNSAHAGTGYGMLTLGADAAVLAIYNADGSLRLSATVTR